MGLEFPMLKVSKFSFVVDHVTLNKEDLLICEFSYLFDRNQAFQKKTQVLLPYSKTFYRYDFMACDLGGIEY